MDPPAALDELYAANPQDFTALRTKLAGEAKRRGDSETAKQISAARKPTTAAWAVNRLVHADNAVRGRLTDLGERLRAAHASMDGDAIRELSAEQRRLVGDLARAAFEEAEIANPSAALREDVTDTLQAAVADAEVAARLGRLTKAEQWSGFGELGETEIVFIPTQRKRAAPPAQKPARRQQQQERAALAAAERARSEADAALRELQSDVATARLRHGDARRRLREAEQALAAAEDAYQRGKQASRDAAAMVREAKAQVRAASAD